MLGEKESECYWKFVDPFFFSGFEIGFSWVFPTKLVPPLPQEELEI